VSIKLFNLISLSSSFFSPLFLWADLFCCLYRYDVLLKADQPVGSYWITAQVQFRTGSPSGYGVLRYKGANDSLPSSPSPPPDTFPPWTLDELQEVVSLPGP
jgi:Multicopper oxidase